MSCVGTPPNPPISEEERRGYASSEVKLGRALLVWPFTLKTVFWAGGICESAVVLAHNFPHPPLTDRILSALLMPGHYAASLRITPTFLLGTLLTALGAYLRHRCYKTLGRLFTYELSVRKGHKLVTEGPYSFVRHPSYLAIGIAYAGINLCAFGRGSLLRESGILDTKVGSVLMGGSALHTVALGFLFIGRSFSEDTVMREQFGEQWDCWAEKVRYRIIPYVF